jgi:uncharacterized RDD family membrane protein YckC
MTPQYREAPLGKRVAAKFTDVVFAFLAASVISIIATIMVYPALAVIVSILCVVAFLGYLLLADGWSGRSVGKRLFGLKVVDYRTGSPCTLFQSFVRNVSGLAWLRLLQVAEEEGSMEAGNYRGTIVIELPETVRKHKSSSVSDSNEAVTSEAPRHAKLDLEGIAEYARHRKSAED